MLGVFASNVGNEYKLGTLRFLLVGEPRRLVLMAGKFLALASLAAVAVGVAVVVGVISAVLFASLFGLSTAGWFGAAGFAAIASTYLNVTLACAVWGLIGAMLAIVLRAPTSAIVIGIVYLLVGEAIVSRAIVGSMIDAQSAWFPGRSAAGVLRGWRQPVVVPACRATGCALRRCLRGHRAGPVPAAATSSPEPEPASPAKPASPPEAQPGQTQRCRFGTCVVGFSRSDSRYERIVCRASKIPGRLHSSTVTAATCAYAEPAKSASQRWSPSPSSIFAAFAAAPERGRDAGERGAGIVATDERGVVVDDRQGLVDRVLSTDDHCGDDADHDQNDRDDSQGDCRD